MEAKFGGKSLHLFGPVMPDLKAVGKRSLEWDINEWEWDGDMFSATPLNSVPSDSHSQQLFPVGSEIPESTGFGAVQQQSTQSQKLRWKNGRGSGKKSKVIAATSNLAVCQVDDCGADLTNAKEYHRRHKVCDMHSKSSRALVGNTIQRFCQQCSRFHVLQEFDEGKRSCRRRLAGHNRRRRKTHPENVNNGGSLNNESSSSYLLVSLLRILSNMHSKW
uniref:Squamosa promter-binding-like protein 38 n=1 Tax=Diospyros sp. 'deyangshi' TaxID=2021615 RepID=A0AA51BKV2_9ERIC|nr:squamosa promter-binding-like protein 38 [Diospyros sp. 'deyangshi']